MATETRKAESRHADRSRRAAAFLRPERLLVPHELDHQLARRPGYQIRPKGRSDHHRAPAWRSWRCPWRHSPISGAARRSNSAVPVATNALLVANAIVLVEAVNVPKAMAGGVCLRCRD
jgi:hypothetical protein